MHKNFRSSMGGSGLNLTTDQQNTVLMRHGRRIVDYLQGHGIQNEQQRTALIAFAEGWDKLSLNGEWDAVLEAKLRSRPGLFDFSPAPKIEEKSKPAPKALVEATTKIYKTKVKANNVSQPDASTCQSSCVGMATGNSDVMGIRRRLLSLGNPGDPNIMAIMLREALGDRYVYNGKASIDQMQQYTRDGEFLILHVFFTPFGHVIGIDGLKDVVGANDYFDSKDPWSEFDANSFSYNNPSINFYDGFYSSRLIYAAGVVAFSFQQAIDCYRSGEYDSTLQGAYCHRILPAKKA
jgi:hypothetical protein